MIKIIRALGIASMLPGVAAAADCNRHGNQAELTACARKEAKRAEAAMNDVLNELQRHPSFDDDDRKRLGKAQEAWRVFRDRECEYRTKGGIEQSGSITPMLVLKCEKDVTLQRAETLRTQLKCPSFDLSCKPDNSDESSW